MSKRIYRKILANRNHPKWQHLVAQIHRDFEAYGRSESVRLGLDPDKWGVHCLRWPPQLLARRSMINQ